MMLLLGCRSDMSRQKEFYNVEIGTIRQYSEYSKVRERC